MKWFKILYQPVKTKSDNYQDFCFYLQFTLNIRYDHI